MEGVGDREGRPAVRRPGDHESAADDVVDGDEALVAVGLVVPRVGRRLAVVTHHPQLVLRHLDLELTTFVNRARGVPLEDVRLVERLPVDLEGACAVALDGVTADADDALDQVLLVRGGHQPDEAETLLEDVGRGRGLVLQPAVRVLEDDHLAARGLRAEPRRELVDEYAVAHLEGVLHRAGRDRERLHQERLDDQRQDQGDDDEQRQFLPERPRLLRGAGPAMASRGVRAGLGHLRLPPFSGAGRTRASLLRLFRPLVSGPGAHRDVPHAHSSLRALARAVGGAGPPLP
ncbi:putative signal peptidase [Streptomyces sp. Tu6071]|nr:putative signal peptidase [Streptomyces sp. Tu6071]